MAAVASFLKIDGIEGESRDSRHPREIELDSFTYGVAQAGSTAPGRGAGGGAGKASFHDFTFTARVSTASTRLFLACASGEHLKSAVLTCRRAGQQQQEFLTAVLTDVLVSQYAEAGGEVDGEPTDQVSLNFSRIELEYRPVEPDGTLGAPVKAGWDLKAGRKV